MYDPIAMGSIKLVNTLVKFLKFPLIQNGMKWFRMAFELVSSLSSHVNLSCIDDGNFEKLEPRLLDIHKINAVWFVALFLFYVLFGFFLELTTSFFSWFVSLFLFFFFF